jgi:hypothetical protein
MREARRESVINRSAVIPRLQVVDENSQITYGLNTNMRSEISASV